MLRSTGRLQSWDVIQRKRNESVIKSNTFRALCCVSARGQCELWYKHLWIDKYESWHKSEGIKEIPPFCVIVRVDKNILSKIFLIKSLSLQNQRQDYFKGLVWIGLSHVSGEVIREECDMTERNLFSLELLIHFINPRLVSLPPSLSLLLSTVITVSRLLSGAYLRLYAEHFPDHQLV